MRIRKIRVFLSLVGVIGALVVSGASNANPKSEERIKLLKKLDILDNLDAVDFKQAIQSANACSAKWKFDCAKENIAVAKKFAISENNFNDFRSAQKFLQAEIESKKQEENRREKEEFCSDPATAYQKMVNYWNLPSECDDALDDAQGRIKYLESPMNQARARQGDSRNKVTYNSLRSDYEDYLDQCIAKIPRKHESAKSQIGSLSDRFSSYCGMNTREFDSVAQDQLAMFTEPYKQYKGVREQVKVAIRSYNNSFGTGSAPSNVSFWAMADKALDVMQKDLSKLQSEQTVRYNRMLAARNQQSTPSSISSNNNAYKQGVARSKAFKSKINTIKVPAYAEENPVGTTYKKVEMPTLDSSYLPTETKISTPLTQKPKPATKEARSGLQSGTPTQLDKNQAELDRCKSSHSYESEYCKLENVAICKKNKKDYWFCSGPVQNTVTGDKGADGKIKQLRNVGCDDAYGRASIGDNVYFFRCDNAPRGSDRNYQRYEKDMNATIPGNLLGKRKKYFCKNGYSQCVAI